MTKEARAWAVSGGLVLLGLVPLLGGAVRLSAMAGGPDLTEGGDRFLAAPVPVVVHIVAALVYTLAGAFQFVPSLRRRGWHRAAGRVLAGCGLAAAASGLWLTLFLARPPGDGDLLAAFRLVAGSAMLGFLLLGVAAIRRRDVRRHRAWMIRAYALGAGAGTQAFTQVVWLPAGGEPGEVARALLIGAGWVINAAVAEWVVRSRAHPVGLVRPDGDLDPVADAQLGHQARDVTLDRAE
ncbi:DUF2306 domain-containing protein [Nonomuraea terrae]|uniref:DUF2306 domain-containing protein n=1 Tax=Nonomuraea terrae TaxID=2530383 RepID=A0A4R4XVR8_9ACTN|nr:DUF2306 domain-containing protein [Nonomuraea terrae]TDD35099.1 DUF2306 domain-containing protein [Nonomuraea terrae]